MPKISLKVVAFDWNQRSESPELVVGIAGMSGRIGLESVVVFKLESMVGLGWNMQVRIRTKMGHAKLWAVLA